MSALRYWVLSWRLWDGLRHLLAVDDDCRRMAARDEYLLARLTRLEAWLTNIDAVLFRLDPEKQAEIKDHKDLAAAIREQITAKKAAFPTEATEIPDANA